MAYLVVCFSKSSAVRVQWTRYRKNGQGVEQENMMPSNEEDSKDMQNRHLVITFGNEQLKATIEDNVTTRNFIEQLPMAITMHDLHSRGKVCKNKGFSGQRYKYRTFQQRRHFLLDPRGILCHLL